MRSGPVIGDNTPYQTIAERFGIPLGRLMRATYRNIFIYVINYTMLGISRDHAL